MKPITKSLIIGFLIVLINFSTYLSFRFFVAQELKLIEGLIFTFYESIVHLIIIVPISYILFKKMK